jgi:hypothetical protein
MANWKGGNIHFEPFVYPSYFNEYYRGLLLLETKIKMATAYNERFRSQQVITDILKERMHLSHLSVRQYFYGIHRCSAGAVWCRQDKDLHACLKPRKLVLASFAQCAYEDYAYTSQRDLLILHRILRSLDQKGYIEKIIHCNLYPDHRLISEQTLMTLHPFEVALADFVTIMMKHLPEDYDMQKIAKFEKVSFHPV